MDKDLHKAPPRVPKGPQEAPRRPQRPLIAPKDPGSDCISNTQILQEEFHHIPHSNCALIYSISPYWDIARGYDVIYHEELPSRCTQGPTGPFWTSLWGRETFFSGNSLYFIRIYVELQFWVYSFNEGLYRGIFLFANTSGICKLSGIPYWIYPWILQGKINEL